MGDNRDWQEGAFGHLRYIDAGGHYIYTAFTADVDYEAPAVYLRGTEDQYWNDNFVLVKTDYDMPCMTGKVTLKDGSGGIIAEENTYACGDWTTGVYLYRPDDAPARIKAGDTVEVTFGDKTTAITVPTLGGKIYPETDTVSGIGPAQVITTTPGVTHSLGVYLGEPIYTFTPATTDASGKFELSFPVDLPTYTEGYLTYWITPKKVVHSQLHVARVTDAPVTFISTGGRLTFAAYVADPVITAPDGTQYPYTEWLVVENAMPGIWTIQPRQLGQEGAPFAFAVAESGYRLYMPVTFR